SGRGRDRVVEPESAGGPAVILFEERHAVELGDGTEIPDGNPMRAGLGPVRPPERVLARTRPGGRPGCHLEIQGSAELERVSPEGWQVLDSPRPRDCTVRRPESVTVRLVVTGEIQLAAEVKSTAHGSGKVSQPERSGGRAVRPPQLVCVWIAEISEPAGRDQVAVWGYRTHQHRSLRSTVGRPQGGRVRRIPCPEKHPVAEHGPLVEDVNVG